MVRGFWLKSLWRRFEPPPIPDALWRRAVGNCPLARRLDADRLDDLRHLSALFLARKHFHALAGAVVDDYWRLLIAMQACLTTIENGPSHLRGWREVLVYPGEFKMRFGDQEKRQGRAIGPPAMVDCYANEPAAHAPLVLSLADVQLDLEQPWDGCNSVVHGMAHKLDLLDGPADGVPPLQRISRRRWIDEFDLAYARLKSTCPTSGGHPIDPHAARSRGEYFAVVSEWHFSRPTLLRETEPKIAELLQEFYGPSPALGIEPPSPGRVR